MAATQNDGELLQKWLQEQVNGLTTVQDAEQKAQEITEKLKEDFEEAWKKLRDSLTNSEASEITGFCDVPVARAVETAEKNGENQMRNEYVKDLCKGLMGIRYFMSGITELSGRSVKVETDLTEDKWFARCTVGMLALSDIYGDHCKLDKVIGYVSDNVEGNLRKHTKGGLGDWMIGKCEGKVDANALLMGRAILGDKIKDWATGNRGGPGNSPWRVKQLWSSKWRYVCPTTKGSSKITDEEKKDELNRNKDSMTKLMKLDTNSQNKNSIVPLSDVLIGESKDYSLDLGKLTKVFENAIQNNNTATADLAETIMKEITKASEDQL
ncbi:SICAvar, type I (fragment), partial [Plasmodium knowlesi strain H]